MRTAYPLEAEVDCPYCGATHWAAPEHGQRQIVMLCTKSSDALEEGFTCCHRYFVVRFSISAEAKGIEGEADTGQ